MNIDVNDFDSDRDWTQDEKDVFQAVRESNINTLKSRRRVKNREIRNETILWAAVATVVLTIVGVLSAIGLKKEDQNFSKYAFTEKDAPYSANITDKDIADGEQYFNDVISPNGKQR